jgi:hypothetical protein
MRTYLVGNQGDDRVGKDPEKVSRSTCLISFLPILRPITHTLVPPGDTLCLEGLP